MESKPFTKTGKFKAPTRDEKLSWGSGAWSKISKETIEKDFKRYLIDVNEIEFSEEEIVFNKNAYISVKLKFLDYKRKGIKIYSNK